jgi:hypothetical protein
VSLLARLLAQGGEILCPVKDERAQLVIAPRAPVRRFEAAPDNHFVSERYLDPKRPAVHLAAYTAEDGDLAVEGIIVVGRIAEQAE